MQRHMEIISILTFQAIFQPILSLSVCIFAYWVGQMKVFGQESSSSDCMELAAVAILHRLFSMSMELNMRFMNQAPETSEPGTMRGTYRMETGTQYAGEWLEIVVIK